MTAPLRIDQIALRGIRNLKPAEYRFSSSVNVLVGGNGQGKTSVLEALCIAATSRSFRTEQLREVIQTGQDSLLVAAELNEGDLTRSQKLTLSANKRQAYIDGKRASSLAQYASYSPIVVFHPSDLELVTGSATTRRNLLARIALYSDPSTQENRLAYARALRHRQLLLDKHPPDTKSLIAFESIIAEHGFELARSNATAAEKLCNALTEIFADLSANALILETHFEGTEVLDADNYRRRLQENRNLDRQRGRATFGPHRDDIRLDLDGMTARHHASQGQQRLLALAIKLAELQCIREARDVHPVLLLDDIVSELDRTRTHNVFEWLKGTQSQIFITAPREDVVKSHQLSDKDQRVFVAQNGQLHTPTGLF